jgi:hypothetical protein
MTRPRLFALALTLMLMAAPPAAAFDLSGVSDSLDASPPEGTDALLRTQAGFKQDLTGALAGLLTSQSSMAGALGDMGAAGRLVSTAEKLVSGNAGDGLLKQAMSLATGYNDTLDSSTDRLQALGGQGKASFAESLLSYAKSANKLGLLDDKLLQAADQARALLEKATAAQSASLMDKFSFLLSVAPKVPDLAASASSTGKKLLDFFQNSGQDVDQAARLLGG